MQISTPGTYNLYLRWDGSPGSEGTNQEVAADIAELKDGPGGTIADWYRASMLGDADFASDPWDGDGGFEPDAVVAAEGPMTWDISEPGAYTLRLSQLTAGASVDAFAFQIASLPQPTGDGPRTSTFQERGKIIVANDEWTLSDSGFGWTSDTKTFALNVASFFTGGGTGNFLVYSANFGLTGSSLSNAMTQAGHAWTISTSTAFTLQNLLQFDGVFLAETPAGPQVSN